ncbi:hypothetical protein F5146DRAFT_721237 [Armillaria mellea]|nr:hypothetical protein F5146DRAFT_721237 [Armillaria mellea]
MSFLRPENPPPEALIPILRGEVVLSDEGVSQIQDTIFACDQAISHLSALLTGQCSQLLAKEATQLNERLDALTQYVTHCRSLFAPIRRLPRDVLEDIFADVPGSADNILDIRSAPWLLAHICYPWRDTVFTTPLLWANISICPQYARGKASMLDAHLQLSGECPLDISYSFPTFAESEDEVEIFSLILQHSTQWKRVQITFLYDIYAIVRMLSTVAGKLPLLEEITFLGTPQPESIYTEVLVTASSLRKAWLPSFNGVHEIPLNSTLTHFAGTITCFEDIEHVMGLPALIECHLTLVDVLSTSSPPLRNDHIQRFSTKTSDILANLTLPSLGELRLACKCRNRDSFIAFFIRSSCNLKSLHIAHSGIGDALVLSEYQKKLERLTIDAGWNDIGIIDSYPNLHQLTIRQTESYRSPYQDEIKDITTHLRNRLGKEGKGRRITSLQISCFVRGLMDRGFDYVKALRMDGLDVPEGEGLQVVVYREAGTWLNSKLCTHGLC